MNLSLLTKSVRQRQPQRWAKKHIIGRIVVFSVNFALWASGILLIVFGSIGVADQNAAIKMLTGVSDGVDYVVNLINLIPYLQGVGIFMIVLGCFLFFLGGNGCHGIMKKSRKSTMMYFIWLLCAILVELALIIYGAVYPTTTQQYIENDLTASLRTLNATTVQLNINAAGVITLSDEGTTSYNWQQMEFQSKCCGSKGWTDYDTMFPGDFNYTINGQSYYSRTSPTCCKLLNNAPNPPTDTDQFADIAGCLRASEPAQSAINTEGCGKTVNNMVYQFNLIAIIISSCLIGAEIVGVIFAARIWKDSDE